jgi:tripartite-type tricarboxylate transporter receptor subunit TctC
MFTRVGISSIICLLAVLVVSTGFLPTARSQEPYPTRPISVIVPWGAGMTDTLVRVVCKIAEKKLGQPMIVENKAGAGGAIGVSYVVKSKPDGYTLGVPVTSAFIIHPHLKQLPYNPLTDIADIITLAKYNFGLAVKADAPWNNYEELVDYARKNPGKFRYATAGVGTTQQICMERMALKDGFKWTHIPFKSGSEAVLACLGGHADACVQGSVDVLPHLKAGKLKMLLSLVDKRWPDAPQVPHVMEKGYSFYAMSFISVIGPKKTPEPILQKLEEVFKQSMKEPSYTEMLKKFQVEGAFLSGKEYSELWRANYDEMGKIIKTLGLKE